MRLFCACYLNNQLLAFLCCVKFVQNEKTQCIFLSFYCANNFLLLNLNGALKNIISPLGCV
ncbi:MAG TPA: hypothetical protein DIW64_18960 [Cellvibrio sp.]|nr:hypothetical protein [Cellvibrio sp.]